MKWHIALAALALVHHSVARGLKTPRSTEAKDALGKLEAQNEALKQRNRHLEAMMQVARNEVHRMDAAVHSRSLRHDQGGSGPEDIESLTEQLRTVKAERKSLADTLRQMLAKNSTKIFQAQAAKAVQSEHDLEQRYSKERQALETRVKEANGKYEEAKEMTQTLQEQNLDLQKTVQNLRAKVHEVDKKDHDLANDKANLVETMRSLMRDTAKAKKELQTETEKEQKEAKELAVVKAKLDNTTKTKKVAKPAAVKNAGKSASKMAPLHLKHEESMAAKIAKMKDINRYIDRADVTSDDGDDAHDQAVVAPVPAPKQNDWLSVTKQVDSLQKQEDVFARQRVQKQVSEDVAEAAALTHHSKGLSDWLGLKAKPTRGTIAKDANGLSPIDALDPQAVKKEKAVEAKKAKADADDGGDGVADLLAQAKDQLKAMDSAEAQTAL